MIKLVFVIIGTLIGAGFASGQEIYLFFFSYGIKGLIGIFISSILIGITIYKSLILINKYNIRTYIDFLNIFIKTRKQKCYFNIKNIINIIINIFILVTFFIMIAGFGAYFEQQFGINSLFGSIILSIFCFIVFLRNVKGVIKASTILVPFLIITIMLIGTINIKNINFLNINQYLNRTNNSNYILSSIVYCSYNSILLIPVLITLKDYLKNKKQIVFIAFITTAIVLLLSFIIFTLLIRVDVDITKLEMPAVYVVSNMSKIFEILYGIIILGSIFTTAISLGTSFLQNTSKSKKGYEQIALIMCITSCAISQIGFSNLINYLYPIFGYLGIIQIIRLMRRD